MPPTKGQKKPIIEAAANLADPEQLRIRINRLMARLYRDIIDQSECDWMEAELQALEQIRDAQEKKKC